MVFGNFNVCPLYLSNKEQVDHLLMNCKVALKAWWSILREFDCSRIISRRSNISLTCLMLGNVLLSPKKGIMESFFVDLL